MQTTGSLRPSYKYHHDYGSLNECHEPEATGDQLLLLHPYHNNSNNNNNHIHHQLQQPAGFIQLPSAGFEGEHHTANCYDDQQPAASDHHQSVLVYDPDRPDMDLYGQQTLEIARGQTGTTQDPYGLSSAPIVYQQADRTVNYGSAPIVTYGTNSNEPALGVNIPPQLDQSVYCEPTQPTNLIDEQATGPSLGPQHQAYFDHYTNGQHNPIYSNNQHSMEENVPLYGENCVPSELNHPQQQVYQDLDSIEPKQQQTTLAGSSNITSQILELSAPDLDLSDGKAKYNYICYDNSHQLHHSGHHFETNNNDQNYLIGGAYEGARRESHSSAASSISDSSSEESNNSLLTRDEKRAREANLPMSYHEIVNLSIDQFNEQLARHTLTDVQLQLIKDIRRRGKNKVAAQSCRKRKMEQINELHYEVSNLASKRISLELECDQLIREYEKLVQDYNKINAIVQHRLQQCPQTTPACSDQIHLPNTC